MWVCGLKLIAYSVWWDIFVVAPYVGVWIETRKIYNARNRKESHPMWVCGLKQVLSLLQAVLLSSHPMWVCGLKHVCKLSVDRLCRVAPYVGVWIETRK